MATGFSTTSEPWWSSRSEWLAEGEQREERNMDSVSIARALCFNGRNMSRSVNRTWDQENAFSDESVNIILIKSSKGGKN